MQSPKPGSIAGICLTLGLWIGLFCAPFSVFSQDFSYRNFRTDWSEFHPVVMEPLPEYSQEDALILDMQLRLDFNKREIRVYQRWLFKNALGLLRFNNFYIPFNVDPLRYPRRKNPTHWFGESDIRQLDARKLKGDTAHQVLLKQWALNRSFIGNKSRVQAWAYGFRALELAPGDELEILLRYNMPATFRLIPYQEVPTQRLEVQLIGRPPEHYLLMFSEGWKFDSLSGKVLRSEMHKIPAINPAPYFQRPENMLWLSFGAPDPYQPQKQAMDWRHVLSELADYQPNPSGSFFAGPFSPLSLQLNRLYLHAVPDTFSGNSPESWRRIQAMLTHQFRFQNDSLFFAGEDVKLERLRSFLSQGILRQMSLFRVYKELIYRSGAKAYLVLFRHRNRTLSEDSLVHWAPYWPMQGLAVETDSGLSYLVPRQHAFGWEANELAFYLRGIRHWHIPINSDYADWLNRPVGIPIQLKEIKNHSKTPAERNIRASLFLFEAAQKSRVEMEVSLKGDWSTLLRGRLLHGFVDSLAHPDYALLPTALPNDSLGDISIKTKELSSVSPFLFDANLSYPLHHKTHPARGFALNLRRLFPMPLSPASLDAFPGGFAEDFPQASAFDLSMHWPETMQAPKMPEWLLTPGHISSDYGKLSWNLIELKANQLRLQWQWESHIGELAPDQFKAFEHWMRVIYKHWRGSFIWT